MVVRQLYGRIRVVHMVELRALIGIRRRDKILNALIRELYGVTKGMNRRTAKSILWWFNYVERMEND